MSKLFYRVEYDAYRMDLESSVNAEANANGDETQKSYAKHKENYEKLRADVAVKMQFLDENRVSEYNFIHHIISIYINIQSI